jgi:hypothetical protein
VDAGDAKKQASPASTNAWKSQKQRFPHSHSRGGDFCPKRGKAQTRNSLVGGGKVEIQKQDSHFPTAPSACGSKVEQRR